MAIRRTGTARRATRTTTKRVAGGRKTATGARAKAAVGGRMAARGKTMRGTARTAAKGGARGKSAAKAPAASRPTRGFGSIFRMRVRPGQMEELRKLMIGQSIAVPGVVSVHLFDTGPDEAWGVAVFKSEKAYRDNASSPEQNARYRGYRALLEADPEWHDGTIVSRMM